MATKVMAAALQYSKWLSRFICWVWALYRFGVLIAAAMEPSAAEALVATTTGMDTIMLVNVSTYLINSLGEKIIYSDRFVLKWLDKGGFKHLLGTIASKTLKKEEKEIEEEIKEDIEAEELEEEENNG